MNFIQAKNEQLYAADRIVSIGPSVTRSGEWVREVEIAGAGPVIFYGFRIEEFMRQPVQAFPAQPDTFIVHLSDEEADGYWKTAVVGWAVARDGHLYPVTADGINDGTSHTHHIMTPDGKISRAEDGIWDSLAHLLETEARAQNSIAA